MMRTAVWAAAILAFTIRGGSPEDGSDLDARRPLAVLRNGREEREWPLGRRV